MPTEGCALVTGAAGGIGAAIARALAADGWPVGVNYRSDSEGAERVAAEIEGAGGRAAVLVGDLRADDAADALFDSLEERFGPVLVLVNNAGVRAGKRGPVELRRLQGGVDRLHEDGGGRGRETGRHRERRRTGLRRDAAYRGRGERDRRRDPGPPSRHAGGGRGLRSLPDLRGGVLRDRNHADRRRGNERLTCRNTSKHPPASR